jgi:xanthine dehydrogenase accessory factor
MTRADLAEMISLAERLLAVGEPSALATLFAVHGSSYRPLGSMMLAGPSAALSAGGISGGCLEDYLVRRGRMLGVEHPAVMLSFDVGLDAAGDMPSLGCGGSIEVLLERSTPQHLVFLRELAAAHEADHASAAVCTIDLADESRLAIERAVLACGELPRRFDRQLEALVGRAMFTESSLQGAIELDRRALVQFVPPLVRLVILGAGNDAQPLSKIARSLGWHVSVADRRARLATANRFPEADQVVAADWWRALDSIALTGKTAVVLMTHSLEDDVEILTALPERPLAYLGVLGPAHRRQWLLERIGDVQASNWIRQRLRGPIGLDLGDRSPAGIAVSIISEILSELNGRAAAPLSTRMSADAADAYAGDFEAVNRVSAGKAP